jgi:4-hydroxybenzoyl-CoA thioesterase
MHALTSTSGGLMPEACDNRWNKIAWPPAGQKSHMLKNRRSIHIEWGDCDPLGIVYFPRYFAFFDACTNALFEAAGWPKRELLRKFGIAGIPLVDAHARFLLPSAFDDTVEIESEIVQWGTSSFSVEHRLFRGATLAVDGFEKRVWTVHDGSVPRGIRGEAIPREVMERFGAPTGT